MQYTSEGFLGCSNPKCGIVFKDSLDRAAEWRYYGADDNYNTDPTRCGMPINPLLKESSYGCKVVCNGRSTYEMRKIRRYTDWQSMPYKEKSQYDEFERIKILARNAEIAKLIIGCLICESSIHLPSNSDISLLFMIGFTMSFFTIIIIRKKIILI